MVTWFDFNHILISFRSCLACEPKTKWLEWPGIHWPVIAPLFATWIFPRRRLCKNDGETVDPWNPDCLHLRPSRATAEGQVSDQSARKLRFINEFVLYQLWHSFWARLECKPRTYCSELLGVHGFLIKLSVGRLGQSKATAQAETPYRNAQKTRSTYCLELYQHWNVLCFCPA